MRVDTWVIRTMASRIRELAEISKRKNVVHKKHIAEKGRKKGKFVKGIKSYTKEGLLHGMV